MKEYPIPLIPGPTSVPKAVLEAYLTNYGSADLEDEFLEDYKECQTGMQKILATTNDIVIMSGEGMVALWGAFKSVIKPQDKVVSVCNGVYGSGVADMMAGLGAEVHRVEFDWQTLLDPRAVIAAINEHKPKVVTVIHCETPSGLLNPLDGIGAAVHAHGGLLCADIVSSTAGCPVNVDKVGIDLGLMGSQKALSCVPSLSMVSVSTAAWEVIEEVGYQGYDALKPFKTAVANRYFPYTPNWQAIAALKTSVSMILDEGIDNVYERHTRAAELCKQQGKAAGIEIYNHCPTVTAFKIPEGVTWEDLNKALRAEGVVVGGSWGVLAGKVFRVGHMGSQASESLMTKGMQIICATMQQLNEHKNVA